MEQIMPKTVKGFIAIDIDGTMLVEKIDHNVIYGLVDNDSHIRETIYWIIALAQEYDIYILTARPKIVEKLFSIPASLVGTKLSPEIVNILAERHIIIKEVKHDAKGLKGDTMVSMLADYHDEAIGILFEDQLKQINDIHGQHHDRLYAFDVNHPPHLFAYKHDFFPDIIISASIKSPFAMVETVLNGTINAAEFDINPCIAHLQKLNRIYQDQQFSDEQKKIYKSIIDDLALRLYETNAVGYKPEIVWVSAIAEKLVKCMSSNELELKDIFKLAKATFDKPAKTSVARLISKFSVLNHIPETINFHHYQDEINKSNTHAKLYTPNTMLQQNMLMILDILYYQLTKPTYANSMSDIELPKIQHAM